MRDDRDALERAADRAWTEIARLLAEERRLAAVGGDPDALADILERIEVLKRMSARFRDVLRQEAWARCRAEAAGTGAAGKKPR